MFIKNQKTIFFLEVVVNFKSLKSHLLNNIYFKETPMIFWGLKID